MLQMTKRNASSYYNPGFKSHRVSVCGHLYTCDSNSSSGTPDTTLNSILCSSKQLHCNFCRECIDSQSFFPYSLWENLYFLYEDTRQRKKIRKPANTIASNAMQKEVFHFQMVVTQTWMSSDSQNITMPTKDTRLSESSHSWRWMFRTIFPTIYILR